MSGGLATSSETFVLFLNRSLGCELEHTNFYHALAVLVCGSVFFIIVRSNIETRRTIIDIWHIPSKQCRERSNDMEQVG
jgi:hypothetical protein